MSANLWLWTLAGAKRRFLGHRFECLWVDAVMETEQEQQAGGGRHRRGP
jgi:hypothetical protein